MEENKFKPGTHFDWYVQMPIRKEDAYKIKEEPPIIPNPEKVINQLLESSVSSQKI